MIKVDWDDIVKVDGDDQGANNYGNFELPWGTLVIQFLQAVGIFISQEILFPV